MRNLFKLLAISHHQLTSEDKTIVLPIRSSIARARLKAFDARHPFQLDTAPIGDVHTYQPLPTLAERCEALWAEECAADIEEWMEWAYQYEDRWDYPRDYDPRDYDDEWRDYSHAYDHLEQVDDLKAWNEGRADTRHFNSKEEEINRAYRERQDEWYFDDWYIGPHFLDHTAKEIADHEEGLTSYPASPSPSLKQHHYRKN